MSKIEVNTVAPQCGTTLTLGESGDTVTLGCGASQTGFGRTGTVDWETSIQTGTVTAATGKGYFVNTTSGGITVNLPVGAVGSIVAVSDYASTADTNNITITPNGSEKINGVNDDYTILTKGLSVTLVYADATRGWKSVTGSDADATGMAPAFITATGGNQPTASGCIVCTNYKIHKFTAPGTFTVTCAGNVVGSNSLDYLVVAGGGGGGSNGGGGGAGGFRESVPSPAAWTASPLANPGGALTAVASGYSITVGGGGSGSPSSPTCGVQGNDSIFSTITSAGGGKAGGWGYPGGGAGDGGSGGGGGMCATGGGGGVLTCGGDGDTPDVTPDQGKPGGQGYHQSAVASWGGGGGGATVAGSNGTPAENGGPGGTGATTSISGTPTAYSGGGAGRPYTPTSGTGGTGGGGNAGGPAGPSNVGVAGGCNTGGGGGGSNNSPPQVGGNGGSGIVIIRYKFQ